MKRGILSLLLLFVWTAEGIATVLNLSGFEVGNTGEGATVTGTVSVQTSTKRTGAYALRSNPTTTNTGFVVLRNASTIGASAPDAALNTATLYLEVYFNAATIPASGDEPIILWEANTGTDKCELRINSAGNIAFYNSAGTLVATGATVLSLNTWYRIGANIATGTSAAYDIQINGVSEISGTADTTTGNHNAVSLGKSTNRAGNGVDFFYDDFIINDTGLIGAGAIELMQPDSDGNYTAFTVGAGAGSEWELIDETPYDSDTTYLISTGSGGDASTAGLESCASAGISGTINGVKSTIALARNGAANGILQIRLRSGSTDVDTGNVNSLAGYGLRTFMHPTDPNGGGAWTTTGLDGIEIGAEENDTDLSKLTAVYAQVHFTAAAGGGAEPEETRQGPRVIFFQ